MARRAVLMIVDGMRADLVTPEWVPAMAELSARSRRFTRHRPVFPLTLSNLDPGLRACFEGVQTQPLRSLADRLDRFGDVMGKSKGPYETKHEKKNDHA